MKLDEFGLDLLVKTLLLANSFPTVYPGGLSDHWVKSNIRFIVKINQDVAYLKESKPKRTQSQKRVWLKYYNTKQGCGKNLGANGKSHKEIKIQQKWKNNEKPSN